MKAHYYPYDTLFIYLEKQLSPDDASQINTITTIVWLGSVLHISIHSSFTFNMSRSGIRQPFPWWATGTLRYSEFPFRRFYNPPMTWDRTKSSHFSKASVRVSRWGVTRGSLPFWYGRFVLSFLVFESPWIRRGRVRVLRYDLVWHPPFW